MTIKELIHHLSKYHPDMPVAYELLTPVDVSVAEPSLSHEEVIEVLDILERRKGDRGFGVDWNGLEHAIERVLAERETDS